MYSICMVKVMRSYTVSEENVEELKNHGNASALIDRLLSEYFKKGDLTDIDNVRRIKQELINEIEILNKKLEHTTNQENDIIKKEQETAEKSEYGIKMMEYNEKVAKLNKLYDNDEIDTDDYYDRLDKLREEKPNL